MAIWKTDYEKFVIPKICWKNGKVVQSNIPDFSASANISICEQANMNLVQIYHSFHCSNCKFFWRVVNISTKRIFILCCINTKHKSSILIILVQVKNILETYVDTIEVRSNITNSESSINSWIIAYKNL